MRNIFPILLAIILTGAFYAGCKEKPVTTRTDLEAPKIFLTSPEIVPIGSFVEVFSSDSFFVDVRFEDDIALRDYEITVRFMPELNYLKTNNDPWKETWFGSLDGPAGAANFPADVVYNPTAGPYEFKVTCTDEAGKTSQVVTYFFVRNLLDTIAPTIIFSQPNVSAVDTFLIGQDIPIVGLANDQGSLVKDVYIRVRDDFTNEILLGSEIFLDTLFVNPAVVDTFVNIGAGTVPGDYRVEFYANDQTFNVGLGIAKIYIKPN
jgi:hypothetical protein